MGRFHLDMPDNVLRPVGGKDQRRLLALASKERLVRILEKMLDESEFFSDHGIRSCVLLCSDLTRTDSSLYFLSLSKLHEQYPWGMDVQGQRYEVGYWPGDSKSGMFGGNSNWRGPICEPGIPVYVLTNM